VCSRAVIILLSVVLLLYDCRQNSVSDNLSADTISVPVSAQHTKASDTIIALLKKDIHYSFIPVTKLVKSHIDSIFNSGKLEILYALNRVDGKHITRLDSLIVPDTFSTDLNLYTPFPDSLKSVSALPKLILFSYGIQAFAAYENGCQVRWGPVSMGKKSTPTPTGLFHTNWKAKTTVSTVDTSWVMNWYFNLMNFKGVSMHEYDLPGYPASHACIRMLGEDAKWLYYWAEQWTLSDKSQTIRNGTPVLIYGSFDYAGIPPWRKLISDNHYTDQPKETIENELSPYMQELIGTAVDIIAGTKGK
jgi:hypothetical protein